MLQADDIELLHILTKRVRVFSLSQWERFSPRKNPRAQLARLVTEKYLVTFMAGCHILPAPDAPLVTWRPGEEPPSFTPLATQLRKRWTLRAEVTTAFFATRLASNRLGGHEGRRPRPSELSHDLALTSVYLSHYHANESLRSQWMSEAALYDAGFGVRARLPDAFINAPEGRHAVEMAGVYTAQKLADFHAFCQASGFGYDLW